MKAAVLVASLMIGSVGLGRAEEPKKKIDLRSAELYLRTVAGAGTKLAPFAGKKLTLLNLWATWCGPCREEMPALNALHKKYEPRGVRVVGLDVDESAATVKKFLDRTKVDYPVILSTQNKTVAALGQLDALPTTIILDENGDALEVLVGAIEVPYVQKLIEDRLETPQKAKR